MKDDNRGFGMIEIMFLFLVIGIFMASTASLMNNSARSTRTAATASNFSNLVGQLRQLVSNDSSCTDSLNLTATPLPLASFTPGPHPVRIQSPALTLDGNTLATAGYQYYRVLVNGLTLGLKSSTPLTSPLAMDRYVATLTVSAVRREMNASGTPTGPNITYGATDMSESIDILLQVDASQNIVACTGMTGPDGKLIIPTPCPTGQVLSSPDGKTLQCTTP